MASAINNKGFLEGKLLIATPQVSGSCFDGSVIYLCAHNEQGAMGVIINHRVDSIHFSELLEQLKITPSEVEVHLPIHFGGPVDPSRGFILHSPDSISPDSLKPGEICLSSSIDMLRDIAAGRGPRQSLLALGYAGWGEGQLEAEIEAGSWIVAEATPELVFGADNDSKREEAAMSLGFDISRLSSQVGHA